MIHIVEKKMIITYASMVLIAYAARGMVEVLMSLIIKSMSYTTIHTDQFHMSCLTVKHQTTKGQLMSGIFIQRPKVLLPF